MLSFLQKEGVQGLASLFDNSAAILLLSITAEPVNKSNNNTNIFTVALPLICNYDNILF